MYSTPDVWHALMGRLADITATFLRPRSPPGVDAVQLFDSWAGALSERDYRRFVLPHSARVLAAVADAGVPRIHFGVGTGELLGAMAEAGADVVGVDWRVPLDEAGRRTGRVVQGNLDPAVLFADPASVEAEVRRILDEGSRAPGHVFNLGHGVLPETDPDVDHAAGRARAPRGLVTVRVAVVGAGVSGLAAAHRLRTLLGADAVITLLEQRDRIGGVLRTVDLAGMPYDVGAEAFLARRPEVPCAAVRARPRRPGGAPDVGRRHHPRRRPHRAAAGRHRARRADERGPPRGACCRTRACPPWRPRPSGRWPGRRAGTSRSAGSCGPGSATS